MTLEQSHFERWNIDTLEHRHAGTSTRWNIDTLEHRHSGTSTRWNIDTLEHRQMFKCSFSQGSSNFSVKWFCLTGWTRVQFSQVTSKKFIVMTLEHRQIFTLEHRQIFTLEHRQTFTLEHRQIVTLEQSQINFFLHWNSDTWTSTSTTQEQWQS